MLGVCVAEVWVVGLQEGFVILQTHSVAGETEALTPPLSGSPPTPSFGPVLLSFKVLIPGRKCKNTQASLASFFPGDLSM